MCGALGHVVGAERLPTVHPGIKSGRSVLWSLECPQTSNEGEFRFLSLNMINLKNW